MADIGKSTIFAQKIVTLETFARTKPFLQNQFFLFYTNISDAFKYILSQNNRVFASKKRMHSPATVHFRGSTLLTRCSFLTEDDALS